MSSNGTATKPEEGDREKPAGCEVEERLLHRAPGSRLTRQQRYWASCGTKVGHALASLHDRSKGAHEPVIPARCALRKDALTPALVFPGLLEPLPPAPVFSVSSCLRISAAAAEFRSTSCRGGGSCFRLTRLEAARMSRVSTTSASATLTVATIVLAATWVSDFIALGIFAMSAVAPRERSASLRTSSATTAKPGPAPYGIGLIAAEVGGSVS